MENSTDTQLLDIFCNPKPVTALVYLSRNDEPHAREISQAIDTTYSHAIRMLNRLEDNGMISSKRSTRKKQYQLTDDGEALADDFEQVIETCAELENKAIEEVVRPGATPIW